MSKRQYRPKKFFAKVRESSHLIDAINMISTRAAITNNGNATLKYIVTACLTWPLAHSRSR